MSHTLNSSLEKALLPVTAESINRLMSIGNYDHSEWPSKFGNVAKEDEKKKLVDALALVATALPGERAKIFLPDKIFIVPVMGAENEFVPNEKEQNSILKKNIDNVAMYYSMEPLVTALEFKKHVDAFRSANKNDVEMGIILLNNDLKFISRKISSETVEKNLVMKNLEPLIEVALYLGLQGQGEKDLSEAIAGLINLLPQYLPLGEYVHASGTLAFLKMY